MATAEGWYTDPYGRHEQRWMSAGKPTRLVRDGETTSEDEPPPGPYAQEPEPVEPAAEVHRGADLSRGDEAEAEPMDTSALRDAVLMDPYGVGPLMGGKPESGDDVERTPTEPT